MITDVAQAIMTKYNETPAGDALRAVLRFTQAKDAVEFPYGVFKWRGSTIDEIAGTRRNGIETATITVHLYSNADDGELGLFDITTKFYKLFDWTELTYPGGSELEHVSFSRISIVNHDRVDKIWEIELDYECEYSH
jgi:hypothetical protein